jgi:hypothetical protein
MFIETACDHDPRSSGAQCSGNVKQAVSLRWSEEQSLRF